MTTVTAKAHLNIVFTIFSWHNPNELTTKPVLAANLTLNDIFSRAIQVIRRNYLNKSLVNNGEILRIPFRRTLQ
jgi:hypothetical protein